MALTFMNEGNVSINKTQEMIKGFTFGEIVPSEGYLAKLQQRAARNISRFFGRDAQASPHTVSDSLGRYGHHGQPASCLFAFLWRRTPCSL